MLRWHQANHMHSAAERQVAGEPNANAVYTVVAQLKSSGAIPHLHALLIDMSATSVIAIAYHSGHSYACKGGAAYSLQQLPAPPLYLICTYVSCLKEQLLLLYMLQFVQRYLRCDFLSR